MNIVRLSLDLASKQTGYCIGVYDEKNNLKIETLDYGCINFFEYNTKNIPKNLNLWVDFVSKVKHYCIKHNYWKLEVAIELSNFGAAKTVNRFNFLCGAFCAELYRVFVDSSLIDLKLFPANSWFIFYGNILEKSDDDENKMIPLDSYTRKKIVYEKVSDILKVDDIENFDVSDAIGINLVMHKVDDQFDTWEKNKLDRKLKKTAKISKQKLVIKYREKISKLNVEISNYKIKEATKPLTAKQKEKLTNLIKELEVNTDELNKILCKKIKVSSTTAKSEEILEPNS